MHPVCTNDVETGMFLLQKARTWIVSGVMAVERVLVGAPLAAQVVFVRVVVAYTDKQRTARDLYVGLAPFSLCSAT